MGKKISEAAIEVLSKVVVNDNKLAIVGGQLDRKLYLEVNEVLESMGGKWNKKEKVHIFDGNPSDVIEYIVSTGEFARQADFGFFETPTSLVKEVIGLADIREGMTVLEPSAGLGALAIPVSKIVGKDYVYCVELQEQYCAKLWALGFAVYEGDFLTYDHKRVFDRVVMNPPFARQQDIGHALKAYSLLAEGGRLVAIMSAGTTFRTNKKAVEFRELIEAKGEYFDNPEKSFNTSGTNVNTITVVLDK